MPGKKQVRLAFCDLAPDWDARDNYFAQTLEHAGWEITFCNGPEEKPDFVLCGTFGFDFLKYDCCRIQFSGEDSWPDLNLYDYAMGFEVELIYAESPSLEAAAAVRHAQQLGSGSDQAYGTG